MLNINAGMTPEDKADSAKEQGSQMAPKEAIKEENKSVPNIKPVEAPRVGAFGSLVILATVLAIVGTIVIYLLTLYKTDQVNQQEAKFNSVYRQLNEGELAKLDKDLQEIMAGATALDKALNSRIYWSKFWQVLNGATPKQVYYNTLTVDKVGVVTVSGVAADFSSVAKLMVSLQQLPVFSKVELVSTSLKEETSKSQTVFSVKLVVKPELLVNR